jgi:membrane protease YdiL (CAAX protease family)
MQNSISYHFRQGFIRMSPPTKILLLVFLVFGFLLISSILGILLARPIFGMNLAEVYQVLSNPDADNLGVVKYFQIIQSVFLFLVPALIAAWLYSENMPRYLHADRKPGALTLLLVMVTLLVAIPFLNALALFNSEMVLPQWMHSLEVRIKSMEDTAGRLTGLFLTGGDGFTLALNMFMIALLPALGEEFLFRGLIQRLLTEWTRNRHLGIWMAAFVFSFIHFQFYGFLPRFLLGLYFGYLLVWSSSIWVPVTGHFINNGVAVLYYHFAAKPMGETSMDKLGTSKENNYVLYLSIISTAILMIFIYRKEKEKKELSRQGS